MATEVGERQQLLRILGITFGIAVVVGGTIGQGILRTPGIVATGLPDVRWILLAWFAGGVLAMIDAMSTVELASSIQRAGGAYAFTRRAFGPLVSFVTGWADWLANVAGIAYFGVVFGEFLHLLGIATSLPVGVLGVSLIVSIGVIQWTGTRISGRSQEIGSAIKALLFLILITALFLAPRGEPVAMTVTASPVLTFAGFIVAMRAVYGTYYGWNTAAYFCEEVAAPGRDIARATFSGIALVTFIYVLTNAAYFHILPVPEVAASILPAADAAARVFGESGATIITFVSLVSIVTVMNVLAMSIPRILLVISRDGLFTAGCARVSATGTPRYALVLTLVCAMGLALIGVYETLLAFSTVLVAVVSVLVNAAAITLRWKEPMLVRPYKMPLYPLPALFSLVINAALAAAFVRGFCQHTPCAAVRLRCDTHVFSHRQNAKAHRGGLTGLARRGASPRPHA